MQAELSVHEERITQEGFEILAPALQGQQFAAHELAAFMDDVVGVIAGDDELSAEFFAASPDLKVLIRWGIGMDSVDHDSAAEHGVVVRNTPGVFGGEVADSAVTYILLLARRHHSIDSAVRSGEWPKVEGISLSGESAGVVGFGDIGRGVVSRLLSFGMTVAVHDPYAERPEGWDVEFAPSLEDLLSRSRFVVLTCPLTPETHHLIDEEALKLMRSDSFLVNVARGPVVKESALEAALLAGHIAGAGLDVFETEPLPASSPLRDRNNVVLGAHNGSNTRQGVARASAAAVDILLEELGRS
jgi:D-3-phosphoglycerate dehydrogenase